MQGTNKKQKFGIFSAGIGAGMMSLDMLLGTLDTPMLIASSLLVVTGIILFFSN